MEAVFADHNRQFPETRFVYPVISRRSEGLSLGINLDYDKTCNFDCPYCQVNRREMPLDSFDFETLKKEIRWALEYLRDHDLFSLPRFEKTPESFRHFRDIAIAGDGEPSVNRWLLPTLEFLSGLRDEFSIPKVVIISNATGLNRPNTQKALEILAQMNGEIWAKLDAGTQSYFETVSGTRKKIESIVSRIRSTPRGVTLIIQSCFMKIKDQKPSKSEIQAWYERLLNIHSSHSISRVQIYTIARQPAQSWVSPLTLLEMKELFSEVGNLPFETRLYSGSAD